MHCSTAHHRLGVCIEKMHRHVQEIDDTVLDALEAQGWKGLRAKLLAGQN
jgi:hypothetical protein